ncbi:mCG147728 [Mus musculus]|nr:mCG147728 [Mus musculus]
MHSPGQGLAVQGRGAQAAALADALASLRRTRARMASLTAYVIPALAMSDWSLSFL